MASDRQVSEDEERRAIVQRYVKGREKVLHEIDEWEDPKFELYHVTDRYGFIHPEHLPERLTQFESKIRATEASRSTKWLKMIDNWEKHVGTEKFRQRVYKGIPNNVRGKVWCSMLGVSAVKSQQEGRYKEMLDFALERSPDVRQIDLDINRTFRNNLMFQERYNIKQQELFRILVAYSVYNSEIGYCQGMSQIAALLLMYTADEEDAFWALDRLMTDDRYAMHGFFIPGFPKLVRFATHHDLVLKRYMPKVYKHFKKYDIDSTLYTLKWFFQCFLDRVPFSLTLRLWDCFMLEGEVILTCMSYTLLKLHKRTILRKGFEELIPFLQVELEKDFGYHDDEAINALHQSILELRRHKMDVPKEPPSEGEKPSKPFGHLLLQADNMSIITGVDDHSMGGSIILRQNDVGSLAATSRASSYADLEDEQLNGANDITSELTPELQRSLSIYDNVGIDESIEAAKRISDVESLRSGASPNPTRQDSVRSDKSATGLNKKGANEIVPKKIENGNSLRNTPSPFPPLGGSTPKSPGEVLVSLRGSSDPNWSGGDFIQDWPDSEVYKNNNPVKGIVNLDQGSEASPVTVTGSLRTQTVRVEQHAKNMSPDERSVTSPTMHLVRRTSIPKLTARFAGSPNKVSSPSPTSPTSEATSFIPRLVNKPLSPNHAPTKLSSISYHRVEPSNTVASNTEHNSFVKVNSDAEKVRIYVPYSSLNNAEEPRHGEDKNKVKLRVVSPSRDADRRREPRSQPDPLPPVDAI